MKRKVTNKRGKQGVQQAPSTGALTGIRVLDLSRVLAGPLCGQVLGDHGATVVKVEGPNGDDTRTWGPPFLSEGFSAYFNAINRNKQNISLDLSTPGGKLVLHALLAQSDVVIENFKAGTLERWGFDYETVLRRQYPGLVYCRISGFGQDGPLGGMPGYDAVLQAYGGLMSINGHADEEPLRVGVPIVDITAANLAVAGILLALLERSRSLRGQMVDITLLDAVVSILHPHSSSYLTDGVVPTRTGASHPMVVPYQAFATSDGPFLIAAANNRQFTALCEVLGRRDLAADPKYATNSGRVTHRHDLVEQLAKTIASLDPDNLMPALLSKGVPAARVNDISEALTSAQVTHRNMVVDIPGYTGISPSIKLSRTPGGVRQGPAAKGRDTITVLAAAGFSAHEIDQLLGDGSAFATQEGTP